MKYLDESKIERFLEQLYLDDSIDSDKLLWSFWINIEGMKSKFDDTYSIFSDIASSYLKNLSYKDKQILDFMDLDKNSIIKNRLDIEIRKYFEDKEEFYKRVVEIIADKNSIER